MESVVISKSKVRKDNQKLTLESDSVDLTPLTGSTNRVKSMGQSIIDQPVNKGQRGQSHMAHTICKPIRLCTWASKCTCNMKELRRKFNWLAFSCSHLNMHQNHFYGSISMLIDQNLKETIPIATCGANTALALE